MEKTTENEKMKDLTAEQQQLVNEIMKKENRQTKVDNLVLAIKIAEEMISES